MRISPSVIALAICAAASVAASAQQAAVAATGKPSAGLSIAYDAPRGQFTQSGLQLKPASKPETSPAPTTGTIDVTVTIKLVSKYPKGTAFPCSVMIIGGNIDLNAGTVEGGIGTVNSEATVSSTSATTATCTVIFPYSWDLGSDSSATSGLILAYAVAAVNAQGNTQRSTLQVSGVEELPASGATSKFAFDAAL